MIDRKLFQETFSTLHASPGTLSEVYKVVRKEPKHHHPISKGVLIAAVLATDGSYPTIASYILPKEDAP